MRKGWWQRRAVLMGVVAVLAMLGMAAGCGPNEKAQAQTTAREFIAALDRDDKQTAEGLMTEAARKRIAENGGTGAPEGGSSSSYTVGEPIIQEVTGDQPATASVPVTLSDEKGTHNARVLMRREGKDWRVFALALALAPGGPEFTMDFERPEAMVGETFKVLGVGMGQMMKEAGRGMGEGMAAFMKGMGEGAAAFEKGYQEETARHKTASPSDRTLR